MKPINHMIGKCETAPEKDRIDVDICEIDFPIDIECEKPSNDAIDVDSSYEKDSHKSGIIFLL